ncbi:MAG: DUF1501 domain-containing protein, partial [Planctomycetaceae bacterium]|nr:DUF1501 domain-containing protein [Planctomycetaceae bacterium]
MSVRRAHFHLPGFSRREMLLRSANGFGALALTALSQNRLFGDSSAQPVSQAGHGPHHLARARNVIFLYMDGGPSQIDTFDPKSILREYNGRSPGDLFKVEPTQFNNIGKVLGSLWDFKQYGESGIPVSDLFPQIATCVDDLAVVRSLTSEFPEHAFANYFLHTGLGLQGRPSMGAWINYGLGSECENLPGFVVLNGGLIPPGGMDCFGSGFLPASFQGSLFKPAGTGVANIQRREPTELRQQEKLAMVRRLDTLAAGQFGKTDAIESAIRNHELAFQMQMAVPDVMSLENEPRYLKQMYGLEAEYQPTKIYAAQCLIARRMIERGVRFIELTCPNVGSDRWDQHSNLKAGHEDNARAVDQPIAALLKDLKQRGLLDETLVVWAGEFGRT